MRNNKRLKSLNLILECIAFVASQVFDTELGPTLAGID
jgi:hypothetical protein